MTMREFPRKLLNLRDKDVAHQRSKSVPPRQKDNKSRPLSAETFRALFKIDLSKQGTRSEIEKEKEETKIKAIQHRLDELNITNVSPDHIKEIMATKFADGDPNVVAEFIDIEQKSRAGTIVPYDRALHLLGAENRENVTCYLDALLFAIFVKLDAFECMLRNDFPDQPSKNELVCLLRMWVNLLRSGKLIRTELEAMGDCGWPEARLLDQQDTSEAFAFLTETLQLPLLSLQVDLFHHGKKDVDDHKVVYERLLNLAIPPDPEAKGLKLEDCLEEYFNARVDVLRDSEVTKRSGADERITDARPGSLLQHHTIQMIRGEEGLMSPSPSISSFASAKGPARNSSPTSIDSHHSGDIPASDCDEPSTHVDDSKEADSSQGRPTGRRRSTSVIKRVVLDERGRPASQGARFPSSRRKGLSVVKAVTIPAWQFFRLIPWHALASSEPRNNVEVAMNLDQRPIVGICLKRYAMTASGQPQRFNTFIDIPDSLRLPHFMLAGGPSESEDTNDLSTEYKLVLQSVVCHRGKSLHSGHYVAYARVAPKLLTSNRRHAVDPPPDYEEAQWVRFDDLDLDNRVVYVEDIKKSLKAEMPYLLFYQIVPMLDLAGASIEQRERQPPSYTESKCSSEMPSSAFLTEGEDENMLSNGSARGEGDDTPLADTPYRSEPPSLRWSLEAERPPSTPLAEHPEGHSTTLADAV